MKYFIALVCFLFAGSTITEAQTAPRATVNQPFDWYFLNSNIKMNQKFGVTTEIQLGFVDALHSMQHMGRISAEYYINSKLTVAPLGYAYTRNYLYGKQPNGFVNNEHSISQQVAYKHKIRRITLNHRLRVEERMIEVHTRNESGTLVSHGFTNQQLRIRYKLTANIPLNHATMDAKTFYISLWDEGFMSRGKQVTYHEPDQNRFFAGFGYQFTKQVFFQAGYFYQLLVKANGTRQENNMGPLWQLNYNFDLTKQQKPKTL